MPENLPVWPEESYLVNHKYKFIYCPIMRVASTPLKSCCLRIAGIDYTEESWGSADVSLRLQITDPNEAQRMLQGNEYFKFVFVRNPFSRLVSAYLAVFMHNYKDKLGRKTILDIKKRLDLSQMDDEKRITFRHFAKYVCLTETLDPHWNPQYLFLGNYTKFDFIGKFENLQSDTEYISRKTGVVFDIKAEKTTSSLKYAKEFGDYSRDYPYYDNCFGDELIELKRISGGYPSYKHFYPPDLKEFVSIRYRKDFEMFGYGF